LEGANSYLCDILRPLDSGTGLANSDEIIEWRLLFVRNLTIDVWILRPMDGSLSPGPCLGNLGCGRDIGGGRVSIIEIGIPVRAFDDDEC
jgi:hypothetical protein